MAGATTTGERHAIGAEKFPGDFQHIKTAATLTHDILIRGNFGFQFHAFPKLSAIAIAFRIAMDLLMVS